MPDQYTDILEMTDDELDGYVDVAFANFQRVTPQERARLRGLIKFYAKKAHPFRSCVRDNTKRFGKERAERICAVLKDLIKGTTKWRGKDAKMSEEALQGEFTLQLDNLDVQYLLELSEEAIVAEEFPEANEEQQKFLAEMYFAEEGDAVEEDGLIWKPILREGVWKFSPGAGQKPVDKPITVVFDGESDPENLIISMSELKKNFDAGAVEHVTIPSSHADTVLENTGFIKALRFSKDDEGRNVLEAGHKFTEPEVREKTIRGTIANTSAGIFFDYIKKETGDKFRSVLAHVALTNKPWLNGMKPFGVEASEDLTVMAFSDQPDKPSDDGGGEGMSDQDVKTPEEIIAERLGLSEDEIKARLQRADELERESRERGVEDKVKAWQEAGKAPALLTVAKDIMMSDRGATVLNLSEAGNEVGLSASDIVERLVEAAPALALSQDPVTDEDTSGDRPKDDTKDEVQLSAPERSLAAHLWLDEGMPEEEAIAEAKRRIAAGESK